MVVLAALALLAQNPPDPENLPIGRPGQVTIQAGLTRTSDGRAVTPDDVAAACDNVSFLLVGEQHGTIEHHRMQAEMVEALLRRGRRVAVGVEYFTRDNQKNVYGLSTQSVSIEEFEETSGWKTQWGHPYAAYRPLWETVRNHKLRVVALNIPRDWVRQASREGFDSFTPEQRKWLPALDLTNKNHRMVFEALLGGHPPAMGSVDIYRGQVAWDTGMAQSAIDWKKDRPGKKPIMVICAGIGHVMYEQAINYRLKQLGGYESKSVVCVAGESRPVSRGIADWVFLGG